MSDLSKPRKSKRREIDATLAISLAEAGKSINEIAAEMGFPPSKLSSPRSYAYRIMKAIYPPKERR